ncbi:MAG: hypothetical protein V1672_02215 [Candidatus Diapherotrites archaeon]
MSSISLKLRDLSGKLKKLISDDKEKIVVSDLGSETGNVKKARPLSRSVISEMNISSGGSNLKRDMRTIAETVSQIKSIVETNNKKKFRVDVVLKNSGRSDLMILDARFIDHTDRGLVEQLYQRAMDEWKPIYITLKY